MQIREIVSDDGVIRYDHRHTFPKYGGFEVNGPFTISIVHVQASASVQLHSKTAFSLEDNW